MLLDLYGDKGLVFQTLATGFKEAHLQDKLKFDVVEADKVGQKFKDAVKEAYNAKYLDDADMVIRFAEPVVETAPEESPDGNPSDKNAEGEKSSGEEEEIEKTEEIEKVEKVAEAETTASGAELKKKVLDTLKRKLFQEGNDDNVELNDLDGYLDGYNVFFTKVSFKDGSPET